MGEAVSLVAGMENREDTQENLAVPFAELVAVKWQEMSAGMVTSNQQLPTWRSTC